MKHILLSGSIILIIAGTIIMNGCARVGAEKPVLLPVKDDPTVSIRIWFKTGAQNDPEGKEGLALLTAALMTEGGTQTNSYEQILEKLYPMAASYSAHVDKEMTVISGCVHKDNLEEYYTLFTDAILKPIFPEEDFLRIKSELLNYLEKTLRYANDEELGKAALYDFLYAGTSYGHINTGTVKSLKSITLDDVREFYQKHFTRDNFVIGLGGGFEDNLVDRFEQDLSALPSGRIAVRSKPTPEPIDGIHVTIIEKECDATAISFGCPIHVLRGDDDFFALALFNSWFGEHRNSSSHLYQVIREKRGMNYGDYSYIEIFPNGGRLQMPEPNNARRQQAFEVWIRPVQNANRHFALRAALRELKMIVDNGMKKEDFELTKKFLKNYALHFAPTTTERLGYAIDSRFYGIPEDYIELFRRKIDALTLEQVNAAIKKHIQYNDLKIAVVTQNAEQFKNDLLNNAPSPIAYSTPKSDEVLLDDKEIEVFPIEIKPENVRIILVDDMFAE